MKAGERKMGKKEEIKRTLAETAKGIKCKASKAVGEETNQKEDPEKRISNCPRKTELMKATQSVSILLTAQG